MRKPMPVLPANSGNDRQVRQPGLLPDGPSQDISVSAGACTRTELTPIHTVPGGGALTSTRCPRLQYRSVMAGSGESLIILF